MPSSSDGVVTAALLSDNTTVKLNVDWTVAGSPITATAGNVMTSTVTEQTNGYQVRGISMAPGGVIAGVDHEAPFGVALSYVAKAYDVSGALLATSTAAAITVPMPAAGFAVWLKSLATPSLSVTLDVAASPQWSADIAEGVIQVVGRPDPIVVQDVRQYETATMQAITQTAAEETALKTLLAAVGPYLLQMPGLGASDRYVTVGKYDHVGVGTNISPFRVWNLPLRQVARPAVDGWSVAIPGKTYADSSVALPTYADRTGTYGSRTA